MLEFYFEICLCVLTGWRRQPGRLTWSFQSSVMSAWATLSSTPTTSLSCWWTLTSAPVWSIIIITETCEVDDCSIVDITSSFHGLWEAMVILFFVSQLVPKMIDESVDNGFVWWSGVTNCLHLSATSLETPLSIKQSGSIWKNWTWF